MQHGEQPLDSLAKTTRCSQSLAQVYTGCGWSVESVRWWAISESYEGDACPAEQVVVQGQLATQEDVVTVGPMLSDPSVDERCLTTGRPAT